MKKVAVCFTQYGKAVIEKLNQEAAKQGIKPAVPYISMQDATEEEASKKYCNITD